MASGSFTAVRRRARCARATRGSARRSRANWRCLGGDAEGGAGAEGARRSRRARAIAAADGRAARDAARTPRRSGQDHPRDRARRRLARIDGRVLAASESGRRARDLPADRAAAEPILAQAGRDDASSASTHRASASPGAAASARPAPRVTWRTRCDATLPQRDDPDAAGAAPTRARRRAETEHSARGRRPEDARAAAGQQHGRWIRARKRQQHPVGCARGRRVEDRGGAEPSRDAGAVVSRLLDSQRRSRNSIFGGERGRCRALARSRIAAGRRGDDAALDGAIRQR